MITRIASTLGWIILPASVWLLGARTAGWDAATIPNALAFGIVVYLGFRYSQN